MPITPHLPLPDLLALRMYGGLLTDEEVLECYHLGLLPGEQAEEVFHRVASEPEFKVLSDRVAQDRDMWLCEATPAAVARVLSWLTRHMMRMHLAGTEFLLPRSGSELRGAAAAFAGDLRAFWGALMGPGTQLAFAGPSSLAVPLDAWRQLEFQLQADTLVVCWTLGLEPQLSALVDQPFQIRLGTAVSAEAHACLEGEMVVLRTSFQTCDVAAGGADPTAIADIELLLLPRSPE